jgi:hypothetical protein
MSVIEHSAWLVALAGCAIEASGDIERSPDVVTQAVGASVGACGFAAAQWDFEMLPQRTGRFTITFYAEAFDDNNQPIDAVIGLANGRADAFTDLGPIVRFNPAGMIDVRNGSVYAADVAFPYRTRNVNDNVPIIYRFRMDVDIPARRYSVWVHEEGGPEVAIATNYAFRTEQSSMTRIDTINAFRDSPNGGAFFCEGRVAPPVCASSSPTSGWANTAFPAQTGEFYIEVDATPSANNIDAVVGLSRVAASQFSDLAAIVRFNPDGYFDARDGNTYRAAMPVRYEANATYTIMIWANIDTGRYIASVTGPSGSSPTIADSYAFRTEQTGVTSLGMLGQKVDNAQGALTTCDLLIGNFPL